MSNHSFSHFPGRYHLLFLVLSLLVSLKGRGKSVCFFQKIHSTKKGNKGSIHEEAIKATRGPM